MRRRNHHQHKIFGYVSPESAIPKDHPLRPIKKMVQSALGELSPKLSQLYSAAGPPAIAPEKLLKALVLQVLYSIRSERMLVEELHYNLLFRWFVGLSIDSPVWDHSTFSENRDQLIEWNIAIPFLNSIKAQAKETGLLSNEDFSADSTLIEAWSSLKNFLSEDKHLSDSWQAGAGGNPESSFRGEKRKKDPPPSITDPDSRRHREGDGAGARSRYAGLTSIDSVLWWMEK